MMLKTYRLMKEWSHPAAFELRAVCRGRSADTVRS